MPKRQVVFTALAGLLLGLALVVAGPVVSAHAAAVKIMPLGDSITGSPGCWRSILWNRLQSSGHTDIDFVGTLPLQGCGQVHDGDNEGHGGILATNLASQGQLAGWLAATRPDIVMMHLGTNDVWSGRSNTEILNAFTTLVTQMRASNPAMRILVAKIIPMNPATCADCGRRVVSLNDAIPAWVAAQSTSRSPIAVVDQWSGFSTASDTYDGVHPNGGGDQKIADRWYPALTSLLDGIPPPTDPSPTPTPPAGGRTCQAAYRIVGQWAGGFQGEVTVTATGSTPISGWTVTFGFTGGQRITQSWNSALTQSGATVTARNLNWNGALGTRATATFGFLAGGDGAGTAPAPVCAAT